MEPTRPNYRCRNLILGSLALIGGCTVGPNYHPPKSELPSSYSELNSSVTNQTSQVTTNTETLNVGGRCFEDSELNSLIQRALQATGICVSPCLASAKPARSVAWLLRVCCRKRMSRPVTIAVAAARMFKYRSGLWKEVRRERLQPVQSPWQRRHQPATPHMPENWQ